MVLKEVINQRFDRKRSKENLDRIHKNSQFKSKHRYDTPEALLSKACSIKNPDKFKEAINYFDLALKKNPDVQVKSLLLFNKGIKLKQTSGKNSEGDKCLKEFIKIAPYNLKSSKKIAKQLIKSKNINKHKMENNRIKNQGKEIRRFNLSIYDTTLELLVIIKKI